MPPFSPVSAKGVRRSSSAYNFSSPVTALDADPYPRRWSSLLNFDEPMDGLDELAYEMDVSDNAARLDPSYVRSRDQYLEAQRRADAIGDSMRSRRRDYGAGWSDSGGDPRYSGARSSLRRDAGYDALRTAQRAAQAVDAADRLAAAATRGGSAASSAWNFGSKYGSKVAAAAAGLIGARNVYNAARNLYNGYDKPAGVKKRASGKRKKGSVRLVGVAKRKKKRGKQTSV